MVDISESPAALPQFDRLHTAISELRKKQVFFVGGTIKSGTTWLQLLLNAHPQVSCNGEAHFIAALSPSLKRGFDFHWEYIAGKNRMIFHELGGYPPLSEEDFSYILSASIA